MPKLKILILDRKIYLVILAEDDKEITRNLVPEEPYKTFVLEPNFKSLTIVEEIIPEEFKEKIEAVRFKLNRRSRTVKFSLKDNLVVGFRFTNKSFV
jgi:hypothetical protein